MGRKEVGLSVEVVHRPPKPTLEKVARIWAEEWSKEGWQIDWQRLLPRGGFEVLPRRWVVGRTFVAWLSQNRRMLEDVSLNDLVPNDSVYRRVESVLDLSFVLLGRGAPSRRNPRRVSSRGVPAVGGVYARTPLEELFASLV